MNKFQVMPPYPWQERPWRELTSSASGGKLSHSILLQGDDGLDDFALCLAMYLLCRAPQAKGACGRCKDCELFIAGSHPDFHYTGLEEKAAQIKIAQIRSLTDFVAKTAQRERKKVVVISPANAMNINAANALLKCLEEPSGETVLLLAQQSQKALLPTIRSRCALVKLPQPERQLACEWLQSQGVSGAEEALRYAQHSPLLVWQLRSEGKLAQWQQLYQALEKLIQHGLDPAPLGQAWKGMALADIVQLVLGWLEDSIRLAVLAKAEQRVLIKLYKCRDSLAKKKQRLHAGFNLNEQLVLDEMAIELQVCAQLR